LYNGLRLLGEKLHQLHALQLENEQLRATIASKIAALSSIQNPQTPFKTNSSVGQNLAPAQTTAVKQFLSSGDRVLVWVGEIDASKIKAIGELVRFIQTAGLKDAITITGIAPDATTATKLEAVSGLSTMSVAECLSEPILPTPHRALWIVDGAEELSAQQIYSLMQHSSQINVQLLFLVNPEQLSSIGHPVKALLDVGMSVTYLNNPQNDPTLERAVGLFYHGLEVESLRCIDDKGWVSEHPTFEDRIGAIAQQWINNPSQRSGTRIITGTQQEQEAINHQLREMLKTEGLLGNRDYTLQVLQDRGLSSEQIQNPQHFVVGDILVPKKNLYGLRIAQPYQVVQKAGDRITFQHGKNQRTVDFAALDKELPGQVYHVKKISIARGDRLVWTNNNHKLGRVKGKEVEVIGFEANQVQLRFDDGQRQQVPLDQLNYLGHALVQRVDGSQDLKCDRVLVSMGTDENLCREVIFLAMTKARYEANFHVDSKSALFERAQYSVSRGNIDEWFMQRGFKIKPPAPPVHIDVKHLIEQVEQKGVLSTEEQTFQQRSQRGQHNKQRTDSVDPPPEQHYKDQYNSLAQQIQSQNGAAPSGRHLDMAIAMHAGPDARKVLLFSPMLRGLSDEAAKVYIEDTVREGDRVSKKTLEQQAMASGLSRQQNTPQPGVARGR
jgi:hypothetical protein